MADDNKRIEMVLGTNGTTFTTTFTIPFKCSPLPSTIQCFSTLEILEEYSNLCMFALSNALEMMIEELLDNRKAIVDSNDRCITYIVDNKLHAFDHAKFEVFDTAIGELKNQDYNAILHSPLSCKAIVESLMLLTEEQRNQNMSNDNHLASYQDLVDVLINAI